MQLDGVFTGALGAGATRVYLDRPYVDFDYRSDLAHFYSRAFQPPPEATERLIFTTDDEVIGVSVVRPLPQQVGRTLLPPSKADKAYLTCITQMPVHAFGEEWTATGYPFTSQDGEYGVCAHAAIWSIARYHHLRFGADRYTNSGIIEAAGLRERPDRTARSEGLYANDIVRAFRGIGLPALSYDIASIETMYDGKESEHTIICRYLNSGIPVGVLTSNHMLVVVGYAQRPNGDIFYVVSDDNYGAYRRMSAVTGNTPDAWQMLIIPQPGRMHVNGESAEARAEEAFEDRLRATTGPSHLLAQWMAGDLRVRTYAVPSTKYVTALAKRGAPGPVRNHHIYAPKANWLWITEFQDSAKPEAERVIGEIAVDATSLQLDPSPLFGNIDGWMYLWLAGDASPAVAAPESDSRGFASALSDRSERPDPPQPAFAPYRGTPIE